MTYGILETGRGLRITIDPKTPLAKLELQAIVCLLDSLIADQPKEAEMSDFEAHLYSSRHHLMRAMKEVQS